MSSSKESLTPLARLQKFSLVARMVTGTVHFFYTKQFRANLPILFEPPTASLFSLPVWITRLYPDLSLQLIPGYTSALLMDLGLLCFPLVSPSYQVKVQCPASQSSWRAWSGKTTNEYLSAVLEVTLLLVSFWCDVPRSSRWAREC